MNKRSIFVLMTVLLFIGCDNDKTENTCGNGVLDDDEICDGAEINPNANIVCSNGNTPARSLIKCTSTCELDVLEACESSCGNNVIDANEQCDGNMMPMVTADCDNPDLTKLRCDKCRIVNDGVCPDPEVQPQTPSWYPENCGNGVLDDGELCDGTLIRPTSKVCPENTIPLGNPKFKCLDSCRLVDVSEACVPGKKTICGNGILEGDEQCDGSEFNQTALVNYECPANEKVDSSKAVCNTNCQIESACVPAVRDDVGVLITEVVPHLFYTQTTMSFDGLAVEITNMDKKVSDLSACSLALLSTRGVEKKFAFTDMSISSLKARETVVLCSLSDGDKFDGVCTAEIADNGILNNLSGMAYIGVVCGSNDEIIDLFNLNSFITGVQNGGLDFVRKCDAERATTSATALLSVGWADVDGSTVGAPAYGLGEHCSGLGSKVASCTYTVSRNTLTERSESIDLSLDVNIPGITDKTDKTDVTSGVQIQFVAGELRNNGVKESIIHLIKPVADAEWTNAGGVDRYVGKLRNWDTYDGFLSSDAGTYVLDAKISFDKGETNIYCGPKGIVSDYETYTADERNTVVVSYDDDGGVCGDGVISSSEVCDGSLMLDEALECENAGETIFDKSKIACSCSMLSTAKACAAVPQTCGDDHKDAGEICDGSDVPDDAKVCPNGMVELDNAEWSCTPTCLVADYEKACEVACGNGKLDASVNEVCDGEHIPDEVKICPKSYVVKDNPVWACSAKCDGIIQDNACELACGNGKVDGDEVCDGNVIDDVLAAATCKENSSYDSSRASCLDGCSLDTAACVYDMPFVFDEFAVKYDDNGKAKGVAISINLYGAEKLDIADEGCNLSVLDANGKFAVEGAYYYSMAQLAGAAEDAAHFELDPCKPFVVCSEPVASESEYKDIWGDDCDALLGGYDYNGNVVNNLLLNPAIDTLQVTCGGVKVDYFDMAGLRAAIAEGYNHGKLKASDMRPYAGRTTVELSSRMDLDKSLDMTTFAHPVCEK